MGSTAYSSISNTKKREEPLSSSHQLLIQLLHLTV
jgi:hypothetical protein